MTLRTQPQVGSRTLALSLDTTPQYGGTIMRLSSKDRMGFAAFVGSWIVVG